MSRVENSAQSVMREMIGSVANRRLDEIDQLALATWIAKTLLVLECLSDEQLADLQAERSTMAMTEAPPATFRCRIACLAETDDMPLKAQWGVGAASQAEPEAPTAVLGTVALGHLLLQAWGGPSIAALDMAKTGTSNGKAIMIWPPVLGSVSWPPTDLIQADQLEDFIAEPFPNARPIMAPDSWRVE